MGTVIINYANQQSVDWLKNQSTEFNIGGHSLHMLPAGKFPKRPRVVVHVEESDLVAVGEAIKLFDRQNADLSAKEWIVMRTKANAKSVHFAAMIDGAFLKALKTCGFKPSCGLGRATVKLLDNKHKGEMIPRTKETA